jgi:hypothetical protein
MRSIQTLASVTCAAMVTAALVLHAAQDAPSTKDDPIIGTWQLNVAKSNYVPGPGPITETRTYKRGANGVEGTIQRRFANGRSERIEYVAEFDREYPVSGTEEYDHILLKRIDSRTAEAVLSHAGRVYGTARRVIAPSGSSMTITLKRESSSGTGSVVINAAVYDKEVP